MQNKGKQQTIELVHKPIIPGSWHGNDAMQLAIKRFLSVLATTAIYLFGSILLSFNAIWGRLLTAFVVVGGMTYYQYMNGITKGENDAAYGEIIYRRREEGHTVSEQECDRSFHALKGLFAAVLGALPFVLIAAVYAVLAEKETYTLGMLPSWTEGMMRQTEFATGLVQYSVHSELGLTGALRVLDRAMIMPFVNVAMALGSDAVLLAERLGPLLVLIAPFGYAYGYARGQHLRDQINTGIKVGDDRKKKREMKARKKRQRQQRARTSKGPEQLV